MKFEKLSYWQVFRLVFVFFFLYLVGEALFRWSGFRFYGSFSEFLPNLCLISILWSFVAILTALFIMVSIKGISLLNLHVKWKNAQRFFLFVYLLGFLGAIIYLTKRIIWHDAPVSSHIKIIIIIGGTLAAIFFTVAIERFSLRIKWMNKLNVMQFLYTLVLLLVVKRVILPVTQTSLPWILLQFVGIIFASIFINWLLRNKYDLIQNQITPLVWLFGSFVIISIPLVIYQTIREPTSEIITKNQILYSEADKNRPNIILITFDALSAHDISLYGYHKKTTPFIDDWAKTASLFMKVKAAGNYTSTTITSLLTGKRVWTHRLFQPHGYRFDKAGTENILTLLKQNGYYNMLYLTNVRAINIGIKKYHYDIFHSPIEFRINLNFIEHIDMMLYKFFGNKFPFYDWIIRKNFIVLKFWHFVIRDLPVGKRIIGPGYDLKKIFYEFIRDIDNDPQEPFFAWMHIWFPHAPYIPPKPYKGMFGPVPVGGGDYWNRDRYDEVIRYCDDQFKNFISELVTRDKLNNTVIILSADHGEMFKDYKIGHSGYYLDEPVTSIPLIIKEYGREEGRVIYDIVEQIDIPATILDFANIPIPSWMEGRSLMPLMRGERLSSKPVFSMNFERNKSLDPITKGIVAVWEGDYKLVYYLEGNRSSLFNLKEDPDELNNLVDEKPEIAKHLLNLIKENLRKANERISSVR
jgi:arylsulfatase A-like enzyme